MIHAERFEPDEIDRFAIVVERDDPVPKRDHTCFA